MIVIKVIGGLGNQMFQYAIGRALALRLGAELWFETSGFASEIQRSFMLEHFSCCTIWQIPGAHNSTTQTAFMHSLAHVKDRTIASVSEPYFQYWPGILEVKSPIYLVGYWQNERYFADVADIIRQDFTFPPLPAGAARALAERISSTPNAVSVHIRRGDYITYPYINKLLGSCPAHYYQDALEFIAKSCARPELFIFSDEPEWVRAHFDTLGFSATVVDFSDHVSAPWHDMHLMSLCRHHIIANSTFSWWGAWLGTGENKIVVAPKRWFAAENKKNDNPSAEGWVCI